QTGAGAAEGLVHGGGDDVGVRHRVGVQSSGHQAGEVGHIGPQVGADLVGDLAEGGEVELARVGGPAGDDHLGLGFDGGPAHFVHVDAVGVLVHPVGGHLVQLAGEVDLHPVGEVPAVGQLQSQDGVTGLGQRMQDGGVRRGAGEV